jgi:hypothetical protein
LNPRAMDNKIKPLEVYTIINLNNAGSEKYYTTKEELLRIIFNGERNMLLQNLSI